MILNPSWTFKYEPYWKSIRNYNRWFIQLRFGAVTVFFIMLLFVKTTNVFTLSSLQTIVILLTTIIIFSYNWVFRFYFKKPIEENKFNEIEFFLYQIIFDLMSLNILVYFTGGIETPFILFYIFHMIIGSMILPVKLIYTMALFIISFIFSFSLLEYNGIIRHQEISGFLPFAFHNNLTFICGYLFIIGLVMLISIALTSKVSDDLHKRELELKKALEELEEAEKAKQKYVMTVVHELKSPISASVSILDLVLGNYYGPLENTIREKLERVKFRIEDSIESINNILRLSRFKLLSIIDKGLFDISGDIEKIIENQRPIAERKNVTIRGILPKTEYNGDRTLLHLSLSNLINNAIKYTPENGLIEIQLKKPDSGLEIEVCDNGIGIPGSDLPNMFSEFFRGSNAKSKNIEGTGTGLTIIKQIVEAHDGTITVESPSRLGDGKRPGSAFVITLPVK